MRPSVVMVRGIPAGRPGNRSHFGRGGEPFSTRNPLYLCMELKVIVNPVGGAGPAKGLLSNLFYACGYNFYRCERQLPADDLLIRGKLRQLLGDCRAHLRSLEAAFWSEHRAPDRDYAFLTADAVVTAQALLDAQRAIEAMETAILIAAAPETSRIHQRHREERGTLEKIVEVDGNVLLALVTLRDAIARLEHGTAAVTSMNQLLRASDFAALWTRREALLSGQAG